MRVNTTVSIPNNIQVYDQPEFVPFLALYGFYEVVGMKAEMSVSAISGASGAGLYAGIAPSFASVGTVPNNDNLVKLPIQTKGNTQGEVFSIYYGFSNDLKKQGAQYAIPTDVAYGPNNQGIICARVQLAGNLAEGTKVGEVKFTWYVRLSSRKYQVSTSIGP